MRFIPLLPLSLLLAALGCASEPAEPAPPKTATVKVEASVQILPIDFETPLTPEAWLSNGARVQAPAVSWSVDRPDLATVDTLGVVRAIGGPGRVTVTATRDGVSGSISLDVIRLPGRLAVERWQGAYEDGLELIPLDGGPRSLVTSDTTSGYPLLWPAWSPDGTRLAFACRTRQMKGAVCVSGADAKSRVRLAESDKAMDFGPSWSPDGSEVVFSDNGSLWRVTSDGRGAADQIKVPITAGYSGVLAGRIAADGLHIAYVVNGGFQSVDASLCLGQLAQDAASCLNGGENPAWSPDGALLAALDPAAGLVTFRNDGHRLVTLVPNQPPAVPATDWWVLGSPTWSPDGQWVAFAVWPRAVFLVRASDGSNLVRLSADGHGYDHPSWGR